MRSHFARWRWLAILAVFAMVAAACQSEAGQTDGDGETTTTTAATDGDGDTTTTQASAEGFSYRVAIFSDPTSTHPWASLDTENDVWTGYVNPGPYAALYGYQGPTYTLVPSAAADIDPPSIEADGDNWSVTVNMRDDVLWSDGTPVTANDVAFTFETIQKYNGLGGNFPALWPLAREDDPATEEDESANGVLSVEAIDDQTVKITFNFEAGLAIWPFSVGVAPIYQQAYWQPIVDAADDFETFYAEETLGYPNTSAFVSAEWEPGAFWRNEAIEDYHDSGSQYTVYENGAVEYAPEGGETETWGGTPEGEVIAEYTEGPYASEVLFSLYSDQNTAVTALTEGDVDFLLNPNGLERGLQQLVLTEPSLEVIVNEQNGYRYLAFNTRKFPMSEPAFRRAIACRIDKEFMANNVLGGSAIATNSQVPPGNSFWHNPDVPGVCDGMSEEERLNEAVAMLKEAGFSWTTEPAWDPDNLDVRPQGEGLTGPDGQEVPPLELLAPGPGYDPLRATYSLFIEEWARQLGIPVTANPTGFSVIVDQVFAQGEAANEWDMYILGWGLTPFPDHVFEFFKTSADSAQGGFNTPGYSNPEFDALADQFAQAKTLEEARDLIFQAEEILAEDVPYVVLFTTPIIEAYRNTINFPFSTTLDGLQNWHSGSGIASAVTSQ